MTPSDGSMPTKFPDPLFFSDKTTNLLDWHSLHFIFADYKNIKKAKIRISKKFVYYII